MYRLILSTLPLLAYVGDAAAQDVSVYTNTCAGGQPSTVFVPTTIYVSVTVPFQPTSTSFLSSTGSSQESDPVATDDPARNTESKAQQRPSTAESDQGPTTVATSQPALKTEQKVTQGDSASGRNQSQRDQDIADDGTTSDASGTSLIPASPSEQNQNVRPTDDKESTLDTDDTTQQRGSDAGQGDQDSEATDESTLASESKAQQPPVDQKDQQDQDSVAASQSTSDTENDVQQEETDPEQDQDQTDQPDKEDQDSTAVNQSTSGRENNVQQGGTDAEPDQNQMDQPDKQDQDSTAVNQPTTENNVQQEETDAEQGQDRQDQDSVAANNSPSDSQAPQNESDAEQDRDNNDSALNAEENVQQEGSDTQRNQDQQGQDVAADIESTQDTQPTPPQTSSHLPTVSTTKDGSQIPQPSQGNPQGIDANDGGQWANDTRQDDDLDNSAEPDGDVGSDEAENPPFSGPGTTLPTDSSFRSPTNTTGSWSVSVTPTGSVFTVPTASIFKTPASSAGAANVSGAGFRFVNPVSPTPPVTQNGNLGGARNMLYFTNWGIYSTDYQPQEMAIDKITHLLYAFADLKDDGTVISSDPYADVEKLYGGGNSSSLGFVARNSSNAQGVVYQLYGLKKRNRKLKTLLSVGGFKYSRQGKFARIAGSEQGRKNFASSAVRLMADWGMDGIDIDWEYPKDAAEADGFLKLLQETRSALDNYASANKQNYHHLLTIAAPVGPTQYRLLNLKAMDQYLDVWNLLSYDYADSHYNTTSHQANIQANRADMRTTKFNTAQAVEDYISAGIAPNKIVLGLPLYGRSFANTEGMGTPFSGTAPGASKGIRPYRDLPLPGAQVTVDPQLGAAWSYDPKTRELVSYDNAESAKLKADYVKSKGLGGAVFWQASGDKKGSDSLVGSMATYLGQLEATENMLSYPQSRYENIKNGAS
ncbi:uncharacterized protein UV8b_02529 [Ustilaginoidea virens]|uniref:chitinase n=1 Tax=Ustilaginoidea virens TaxID=1159556 RepID=A0A8E5MFD4_USTVR|nr:uncharacterized protein UV8b_02529 [Ustilaginoidea virens]QUC18288.1 hypothetical protein UV8b_02529 [Ustilaginoidea virens]